jgi:hypothetical protein
MKDLKKLKKGETLTVKALRQREHQREVEKIFAASRTPLQEVIDKASEALHEAKIKFAFAGGLARSLHGTVGTTEDVDLLLLAKDESAAEKALLKTGFVKQDRLDYSKPKREIVKFRYNDRELDLLLFPSHGEFAISLLHRAQNAPGLGLVISVEDLVLLKLFSFRLKDKAHIVDLLKHKKLALDYVKDWCSKFGIIDRYGFLEEDHSAED